jgi:hypothetical protein
MPNIALYTALVEFPCPNKIDCFVHTDRDRDIERDRVIESIFTINVLDI